MQPTQFTQESTKPELAKLIGEKGSVAEVFKSRSWFSQRGEFCFKGTKWKVNQICFAGVWV
jgi:hypothetical protein